MKDVDGKKHEENLWPFGRGSWLIWPRMLILYTE